MFFVAPADYTADDGCAGGGCTGGGCMDSMLIVYVAQPGGRAYRGERGDGEPASSVKIPHEDFTPKVFTESEPRPRLPRARPIPARAPRSRVSTSRAPRLSQHRGGHSGT